MLFNFEAFQCYQKSEIASQHVSRKDENSNSKRYTYPNVHCSIIYNSQDMEAT